MSSSELLTDAYLIELLQRDAQRKPTRRSDAPKPNTRFLRNIVRDVDSHNSALKAREEADARARQRRLRWEEEPSRSREEDEEQRKRRRRREDATKLDERDSQGRQHRNERNERRRDRSRSPRRRHTEKEETGRVRSRKHRHRSTSRSRSPLRSPRRSSNRHHHSRSERRPKDKSPPTRREKQPTRSRSASSSTSDPLEEFLGPQPFPPNQTLPRGRGAFKPQSSSIETRFREGYDPKTDVREDEEDGLGDDWDRALEAVRDRAKWRGNGADRLRAAGFTDQEVKNWESGPAGGGEEASREKDVRDVRWMKKGEGVREWDRGKGEDGKADWIGRLT